MRREPDRLPSSPDDQPAGRYASGHARESLVWIRALASAWEDGRARPEGEPPARRERAERPGPGARERPPGASRP